MNSDPSNNPYQAASAAPLQSAKVGRARRIIGGVFYVLAGVVGCYVFGLMIPMAVFAPKFTLNSVRTHYPQAGMHDIWFSIAIYIVIASVLWFVGRWIRSRRKTLIEF